MPEIRESKRLPGSYVLNGTYHEDQLLVFAQRVLAKRHKHSRVLGNPIATKQYLQIRCRDLTNEVFSCIFMDAQNREIATEDVFFGTIDGASVYPREVVRKVLEHNAASVIFFHNHPSGVAEPSQADHRITERLQQALALIDVRVLDHFVVGRDKTVSFAENGWL